MSSQDDCIFCKIVRGEIPAGKVFEDEDVVAFLDIKPVAPVHILVIPKKHIASLTQVDKTDAPLLGKMLALAPTLAVAQGADDGFRVIINAGRVGQQEVPHLHIHIIGGPHPLGAMLAR